MADTPDTEQMQPDDGFLPWMAKRAEIMQGRWFSDMTPREARAVFAKLTDAQRGLPGSVREVGRVTDEVIDSPAGPMKIRIYQPRATGPVPVVVYFHGGGFVIGDIESHDETTRMVCDECAAVVVSVDYPLAPEHRFPVPFAACVDSVRWVKANIAAFGGDPDAVVVMGDSAGANLAAATALECAARGIGLAGQAIVYGTLVHLDLAAEAGVRPWPERDLRFGPTLAAAAWYWGHYTESPEIARNPRASILFERDLRTAPPAFICAGLLDTFCAEGTAYGRNLADSGVKVQVREYPRLTHGFLAHGWLPPGNRSELAYEATMETLREVKRLAYA
jgi:acetyl esterase